MTDHHFKKYIECPMCQINSVYPFCEIVVKPVLQRQTNKPNTFKIAPYKTNTIPEQESTTKIKYTRNSDIVNVMNKTNCDRSNAIISLIKYDDDVDKAIHELNNPELFGISFTNDSF